MLKWVCLDFSIASLPALQTGYFSKDQKTHYLCMRFLILLVLQTHTKAFIMHQGSCPMYLSSFHLPSALPTPLSLVHRVLCYTLLSRVSRVVVLAGLWKELFCQSSLFQAELNLFSLMNAMKSYGGMFGHVLSKSSVLKVQTEVVYYSFLQLFSCHLVSCSFSYVFSSLSSSFSLSLLSHKISAKEYGPFLLGQKRQDNFIAIASQSSFMQKLSHS